LDGFAVEGGAAPLLSSAGGRVVSWRENMVQAWDFVDAYILWGIEKPKSILDTTIDEMELPIRCYNTLKMAGIHTLGELIEKTAAELLRAPNFGKVSLADIREMLTWYKLKLKDD
jgi:DNA-directed RNA polymerase alpha subunit